MSAGVAAAQWLALRLQLIAAVIVFSVALLAVLDTENVLPSSTSRRFVNVGEQPLPPVPSVSVLTAAMWGLPLWERRRQPTRGCGCAELIALSLAYALPISSVLNGLLTASAETEMEMVAVERVLQYSSIRTEASSAGLRGEDSISGQQWSVTPPDYAVHSGAHCDPLMRKLSCGRTRVQPWLLPHSPEALSAPLMTSE